MPVTPTDPLILEAAHGIGLPPAVVAAQVNVESGGSAGAVSPAGAEGEFQFLPSTYTGLGFPAGTEFDPKTEVRAYIKYMTELLQWAHGDVRQALAAYNAGQGNWQAGLGYADTILSNSHIPLPQWIGSGVAPGPPPSSGGGLGGFVTSVITDLSIPGLIGSIGGVLRSGSAVAQAIAAVAAPLVKIAEAIDWFFHPAHWIRLFAGIAGGVLVLGGIWQMSHAAGT